MREPLHPLQERIYYILLVGIGQRRTIGRVGIVPLAAAREEARRVIAERTLGIKPEPPA